LCGSTALRRIVPSNPEDVISQGPDLSGGYKDGNVGIGIFRAESVWLLDVGIGKAKSERINSL
jgi:hypothetical protein